MIRRLILSLTVVLALLPLAGVSAQAVFDPEKAQGAGIAAGELVVYTADGAIPITQDAQGAVRRIAWHGDVLAYTRLDDEGKHNLWASVGGQPPFALAGGLEALYPFSFTDTGLILFAQESRPAPDGSFMTDVFTIAPQAGAQPQAVGSIDSTAALVPGCGGGSPLPTDWQYWGEAGFAGRHTTLALTPYGLVYSVGCVGERTALVEAQTGAVVALGENFGSVALSPERARLVGTVYDSAHPEAGTRLALADLQSREVRLLETTAAPDQVAWSPEGDALFYTVFEALPQTIPMTAEEQAALGRVFGPPGEPFAGFPLYAAAIRRYDLASGADTLVYSAPDTVASIGRIFAREGRVIFSQISNLQGWIAALAAGAFDPASPEDSTARQLAAVPVEVVTLDLASGSLSRVGEGINQYTPR